MHPLQKRSLLALVTMIETALQQMKSLLVISTDPGYAGGSPQTEYKPQSQPGQPDYLSESEEEAFERLLEKERSELERDHAKQVAEFWNEDE